MGIPVTKFRGQEGVLAHWVSFERTDLSIYSEGPYPALWLVVGSGLGIVGKRREEEALSWLSGMGGTHDGLREPSSQRVETWP